MDIIRTDYADEIEVYLLYSRNGVKTREWTKEKVAMKHKDVKLENRRCPSCHGPVRIHIGDLPADQWHFEHINAEDAEKCPRSPMAKNQIPKK